MSPGLRLAVPNDAPPTSTGRPRTLSAVEQALDGGVTLWSATPATAESLTRNLLRLASWFCLPGIAGLLALEAADRKVAALCEYWNPTGHYQGD